MTDKEFDKLIKDSLNSDVVPPKLNESLMLSLEKKERQKAKILKFVKACSSCAAVFICAVAVISYFNTDMPRRTEITPAIKNDVSSEEFLSDSGNGEQDKTDKAESELLQKSVQTEKLQPKNSAAEKSAPLETQDGIPPLAKTTETSPDLAAAQPEDAAAPVQGETATAEYALDEHSATGSAIFSRERKVPAVMLGELFNEEYDYKTVISEKINTQIEQLPYADAVTFTQISGVESFTLNEENLLTIEFAAGTIAPEEHGDLFFTVGTVNGGVLE